MKSDRICHMCLTHDVTPSGCEHCDRPCSGGSRCSDCERTNRRSYLGVGPGCDR